MVPVGTAVPVHSVALVLSRETNTMMSMAAYPCPAGSDHGSDHGGMDRTNTDNVMGSDHGSDTPNVSIVCTDSIDHSGTPRLGTPFIISSSGVNLTLRYRTRNPPIHSYSSATYSTRMRRFFYFKRTRNSECIWHATTRRSIASCP